MNGPEEPTEETGARDGNRTGEPGKPVLTDSLRQLCAELVRVKARARELSLFVEDRPLLECPHCRLMEDVTVGGYWVVYARERFERDANPRVTQDWDTGLRFADLSEEQFLCPACGTVFTVPEEKLSPWLDDSTDGNPESS